MAKIRVVKKFKNADQRLAIQIKRDKIRFKLAAA